MKEVKIAPTLNEIEVGVDYVETKWNNGIRYEAKGLNRYKDEYLKECFSMAIAMCGKRWVLEELLNNVFRLDGKVM